MLSGTEHRVIVVGEILFDHFPTYRRLGGAPFNFSYHLKYLGIPVRFITRVGNDSEGEEIVEILAQNGFNTDDIQIDGTYPTGRVTVRTDSKGVPLFHIHTDVAYDHLKLSETLLPSLDRAFHLIYYGSLIQRSARGSEMLQRFLSTRSPDHKCLCDINLRPDCYSPSSVLKSLEHADILKLNDDELKIIGQISGIGTNRLAFIDRLRMDYSLDMISLTKGSNGSDLFVDGEHYTIENDNIDEILDTVGAGDAYAAIVAIGYLRGWDPNRILSVANQFSGRLCTVKGAIPPVRFYDEFRDLIEGDGK